MKLFVAGATGVVGLPAVSALVSSGHQVSALARNPEKARLVTDLGAQPVTVDLFDAGAVHAAVDGHDGVINLATAIPPLSRAMRRSAWVLNDRIRAEAAPLLARAAAATGAELFVQESVAFAHADRGSDWIDDGAPLVPSPVTETLRIAEPAALEAEGLRGVVLRFGQLHGPTSSHDRTQLAMARRGLAPPGRAGQHWPHVHADDAGAAVAAVVDAPDVEGVLQVVTHSPTQEQVRAALASAVGRRRLVAPPWWTISLGGAAARSLLRSQRVAANRLRDETDWTPTHPTIDDILRSVHEKVVP